MREGSICLLVPLKASFVKKGLCRDMVLMLWDTMSQSMTPAWDISSQKNQDTGPITNTPSRGMLMIENVLGKHVLPKPSTQQGDMRLMAIAFLHEVPGMTQE